MSYSAPRPKASFGSAAKAVVKEPKKKDAQLTMQLQGVTKAMVGGSLKKALGAICASATAMLGADRGTVFLLDKKTGVLHSKFESA